MDVPTLYSLQDLRYALYDLRGKMVQFGSANGSTIRIGLENIASGNYFLRIVEANGCLVSGQLISDMH